MGSGCVRRKLGLILLVLLFGSRLFYILFCFIRTSLPLWQRKLCTLGLEIVLGLFTVSFSFFLSFGILIVVTKWGIAVICDMS
ncbi:hypothetical protein V1508DRAFT_14304 [Lipomyces doorenjongii]|uniref:uncharacterized protein n=1 Tax=Lipomyces doorenjongii TaxID=383834 RepID=UPI0034CDBD92